MDSDSEEDDQPVAAVDPEDEALNAAAQIEEELNTDQQEALCNAAIARQDARRNLMEDVEERYLTEEQRERLRCCCSFMFTFYCVYL